MSRYIELYERMLTIRRFEETLLDNFPKGVFYGTTHTYLGQEANAAAVLDHLQAQDIVFSNHRCHGHFLAYGGDPRALFAELMGRTTGVCGGRGGSQHLHWRNFYSNGVQGGFAPISVGMALAEKRRSTGAVTIAFLGDGTLGQGVVYEALNLAALWAAPVLFVLEDNHIAQTTPTHLALAGDMAARFAAFGLPVTECDSSDVRELLPVAAAEREAVRQQQQPRALILHTCRFGPHSKGDDTRPAELVAELRQTRDPLALLRPLVAEAEAIEARVEERISAAYETALKDPFPEG
jgi:TPP-dependent pyruvate/acetoin dehydrogenase alpha subunit